MRKMLIVLAGASLVLAGACSGDDEPNAYNDETESNFIESCAAGGDEATCQCMYDKIVETVPFEEFKALDEELQDNPNAQLPDGLTEAMTSCVTGTVTP